MFCSNCGKEVDDKALICVNCNCAVKNAVLKPESQKSFTSVFLLCFFLGGVGAHRFYTGHTYTAITMLILCISLIGAPIAALWAFIDLIRIITGGFKTASGESLKS